MILLSLKELILNGRTILPGEHISTKNPEQFLQRGYARRLTKDETAAILDEYVRVAERIFNKKEVMRTPQAKYVQGNLI